MKSNGNWPDGLLFGNSCKYKMGSSCQYVPNAYPLFQQIHCVIYFQYVHRHMGVKLAPGYKSTILLKRVSYSIVTNNDENRQKFVQPNCKYHFLQFEHIPLTTIFTLFSEKLAGRLISGMDNS